MCHQNRDVQGRIVLTLRELLGTWSENAACFAAGETVVGIVRSVEDYGVFIEIAPNLAGLAETDSTLRPGQAVSVYIKNILPDKMKIKLVVVNKNLGQPLRFEPHYFVTRGRSNGGPTPHRRAASRSKRYFDFSVRFLSLLDFAILPRPAAACII